MVSRWLSVSLALGTLALAPARAFSQGGWGEGDREGWRGAFRDGPRGIARAVRARLLPDLTAEQQERLREVRDGFVAEAKGQAAGLRDAGREFVGSALATWATLSDEQKAKGKALARRLRDLPPPRKLMLGLGILRAAEGDSLKADVAAFLEAATAEAQVEVGEGIARRVAEQVRKRLAEELGLDAAQVESLRASFESLLEATRAARTEVHRSARKHLESAWQVLTDAQKERIESARAWVLGFLSAGDS